MDVQDERMRENREEEPRTTEEILSLGLGLTADKKTMEERVRGVFSRRHSTALAAAVAFVIVALALLLCFTTVLRPVKAKEGMKTPVKEVRQMAKRVPGANGQDDTEIALPHGSPDYAENSNAVFGSIEVAGGGTADGAYASKEE